MKRLLPVFFLVLAVSACGKPEVIELPAGPQILSGILSPLPVSLKRRGTHELKSSQGVLLSYAESRDVSLRTLEGREVTVQGVFEHNVDPSDVPVLVVQKVLKGGEEEMKLWTIPSLRLSMRIPKSWKGSLSGKNAQFTASGSLSPSLTITQGIAPSFGPDAELFIVGLKKATAAHSVQNASWVAAVEMSPSETIIFTFAVDPAVDQREFFKRILRTVSFTSGSSSSVSSGAAASSLARSSAGATFSSVAPGSRAMGEGSPCGGTAGILCPKGLYCRITDAVNESGNCAKR